MAGGLGTSRLLLRPWRDEDIAAFAEMSADPAVMKYLLPLSKRGLSVETWVARKRAHWAEHCFGQWVVELPGAASFIGVVGLETVSYEAHFTPALEVAWRLTRPLLEPRLRDRGRPRFARLWLWSARIGRNRRGDGSGQSPLAPGHAAPWHDAQTGG